MKDWLSKYWSWLFIFTAGPLLVYLTAALKLQNAPVSPILLFFVIVLFLPPWEAGIGFLIAVSYSTLQRLGIVQPSLFVSDRDAAARLAILTLFAALIVYIKLRLQRNTHQRETLIEENVRKQTEINELYAAGERITAILQSQPVAVIVSNRDGAITNANSAAHKLFGYEDKELLSLHIADLVPEDVRDSHKSNRLEFFDKLEDRSMNPHENFSRGVRKDGTELRLRISLGWFELDSETLVISTIEDVSEKLELEAVKIRAESAEETIRVRDRFLSIAAHELKTPIASIVLYADLLETYYMDTLGSVKEVEETFEARKELTDKAIKAIQRQALNISLLVNQFLDISLLRDINIIKIRREHLRTCNLLTEIIELSQLQTDKHKIILACEHDMDGYVDRLRMEQIVVNLLNNAIKYSPYGGDIVVTATELPGHAVSIDVRDFGLGIPEEAKDKIFTRFFRAHADLVPEGLGLGLYLSKEIMKAHEGTISFRTPEDGKGGTVFNITFPPEEAHVPEDADRKRQGKVH